MLTFVKLGGSLITDKEKPLTPQPDLIAQASAEIAQAVHKNPGIQLLLGHGSGSFGHVIASQFQTQAGGEGQLYWEGFAKVWAAARQLNQIVIENLIEAGLPAIAFPPSAGVIAGNKALKSWDLDPMKHALAHQLIPVVQGDVIFDTRLGGTIFSTEQVFHHLAKHLKPRRILLAGLDKGVYRKRDQEQTLITMITPSNFNDILPQLSGAQTIDVTGGMRTKVEMMLELVKTIPDLEVQIFSGLEPGNISEALAGGRIGTLIRS